MSQEVPSSLLQDNYLTGSKYFGKRNELGMQGNGAYVYPDGTEYYGDFKNNRFHGPGCIRIPGREGVTFMVTHHHGQLTSIDDMEFNDHLHVNFEIRKERKIDFNSWMYCTAKDRRFYREITGMLEPVGPDSFKSMDGPIPAPLNRNIFDLGFGHLSPQGFILSTHQSFYLGCRRVRRWIRENCRHGGLMGHHLKQKIKARFTREIIENNLKADGCSRQDRNQPGRITTGRICRRSASLDSFKSQKSTRVHQASPTDSRSSGVEFIQKRQPVRGKKLCQSKSESNVCRIH